MPLVRRVPKRGFHSPFKKNFQIVNLETLERLSTGGKMQSGVVTPELLAKVGAVKRANGLVKILGDGQLKARLDVAAHAFSKSAVEKIGAAGGKTRVITSITNE